MAFPTAVNQQITDAITRASIKILGDAPTIALENLYQATAQALSHAAHHAATAQQQTTITMQAATSSGVTTLYTIDIAADTAGTVRIRGSSPRPPAPTP